MSTSNVPSPSFVVKMIRHGARRRIARVANATGTPGRLVRHASTVGRRRFSRSPRGSLVVRAPKGGSSLGGSLRYEILDLKDLLVLLVPRVATRQRQPACLGQVGRGDQEALLLAVMTVAREKFK